MKVASDRKFTLKWFGQWSGISRIAEEAGIDRTTCALGAPWFLIGVVGMLGIAWALREFDESIVDRVNPRRVSARLHAASLPTALEPETEGATEGSVEQGIVEQVVAPADSKGDESGDGLRRDAGENALREIIAQRNSAENASRKSVPRKVKEDAAPIVINLLHLASKLARQSPLAVDHLIAVAERQSRLEGKPGMDTSLQLATNEAHALHSDQERARALTKVTSAQARFGELDDARATSRLIDYPGMRDSALVVLSKVEAGRDNIAAAKRTAMGIQRPENLADALTGIAQTQAKKRDAQGARLTASRIVGSAARSVALQRIAMVQASQADIEGAQLTVRSIPDVQIKDRSKAELVQRSLNMGDVCCADFIASSIQLKNEKDRAYESISRYRASTGDLPGASQLISRINNRITKSRALTHIAIEEAKALDFNTARNTAARIPDTKAGARALAGIAKVQADIENDARSAKFTAQLIKDGETEASALKDIAGALARNGQMSHALITARGIPLLQPRSAALLEISKQHLRQGEVSAAHKMLDHARDVAYAIPFPAKQSNQLCNIAIAEARSGDFRDAVITARNIEQTQVRDDTLARIALELAGDGEVDDAWTTAESIENTEKQQDTILEVASSIGCQAPLENAPTIVQHFPTPEEKIYFILSVADQGQRQRRR